MIVNTAEYHPLSENEGWQRNAAGYLYNIRFGFGLMNADSYVNAASNWTNVGPQMVAEIENPTNNLTPLSTQGAPKTVQLTFDYAEESIQYLEHVEVVLDLEYSQRGALEFYLTSPQQTKVQLLGRRPRDRSRLGFKDWSFMSVATWSENPNGIWLLDIVDNVRRMEMVRLIS